MKTELLYIYTQFLEMSGAYLFIWASIPGYLRAWIVSLTSMQFFGPVSFELSCFTSPSFFPYPRTRRRSRSASYRMMRYAVASLFLLLLSYRSTRHRPRQHHHTTPPLLSIRRLTVFSVRLVCHWRKIDLFCPAASISI